MTKTSKCQLHNSIARIFSEQMELHVHRASLSISCFKKAMTVYFFTPISYCMQKGPSSTQPIPNSELSILNTYLLRYIYMYMYMNHTNAEPHGSGMYIYLYIHHWILTYIVHTYISLSTYPRISSGLLTTCELVWTNDRPTLWSSALMIPSRA